MPATALFIPGNMCDARMWGAAGGVIAEALVSRGCATAHADTTRDDTIAGMAARALAAQPGPLLAVGFSMGAIVALEMARQAPERIVALALSGLNAGPDLAERSAARLRQQAEVRGGGLERVLVEELKPNYLAARHRGDGAMLALLRDMGLALGAETFCAQSEALRLRGDLRPLLPALTVPVWYGCGEEDALCPPAWHRDWASRTPRAHLGLFAGAGHMLPLEQPVAFADVLGGWIDEFRHDRMELTR